MSTTAPPSQTEPDVEELANRLFQSMIGTTDMLSIYLGDRLGWYRTLHAEGPLTSTELATRTNTDRRYAREWLEHQAVTGFLTVHDNAHQSLWYLGPFGRMVAAATNQLPALLEAYRSGNGVSWSQLGADARESQADMNRPWYEQNLAGALARVSAVDTVLRRPDARIADIGCGGGWSTIALARAYPNASVEGIDADAASVDMARANAAATGMADRVRFAHGDAEELSESCYDAVFAFECVHDMPHPVEVLGAAARSLTSGGCVVVMDEAVGDEFTAPGNDIERLMYGFSLLVCLPDGMSHPSSAGTGTVMRPSTLREYARQAGLTGFEILPIEDFGFWRFYRLTP
jgi:predicted O-methyltransferase YrrM